MKQVIPESEQWTRMQDMLEQVRLEMQEMQTSRDTWQRRAIASDINLGSLNSEMLEWKPRAGVRTAMKRRRGCSEAPEVVEAPTRVAMKHRRPLPWEVLRPRISPAAEADNTTRMVLRARQRSFKASLVLLWRIPEHRQCCYGASPVLLWSIAGVAMEHPRAARASSVCNGASRSAASVTMEHRRAAGASAVLQWSIPERCRCYDGASPGCRSMTGASWGWSRARNSVITATRCCNPKLASAAAVAVV
ncbi:uncharacterized protein [Triticum aestivum]|nr:uncharacterized protein LOC123169090 isoform X2 [Triticum aestivum]